MKATWDKSFETGIELVDKQHKRLFEIINDLDEAINASLGANVHKELFEELANYLTEHFGTEERLMDRWKYPRYEEHLNSHNGFTAKVRDFHKKSLSGDQLVTEEILDYLTDWLVKHIKAVDLQMGEFLRSKGER